MTAVATQGDIVYSKKKKIIWATKKVKQVIKYISTYFIKLNFIFIYILEINVHVITLLCTINYTSVQQFDNVLSTFRHFFQYRLIIDIKFPDKWNFVRIVDDDAVGGALTSIIANLYSNDTWLNILLVDTVFILKYTQFVYISRVEIFFFSLNTDNINRF